MKGIYCLHSSDGRSEVKIDRGELISYRKEGHEYIHQKGAPGWRNSDTEMFPIIGPTEANNYGVHTDRGVAIQDQHGLLRELNYVPINETENSVEFQKIYNKNSKVDNTKYPEKSPIKQVFWPYSFEFIKKYHLSNETLDIQFEIKGEKGMPFMLGYHPAFRLSGKNTEAFKINKKHIPLQDIIDAGSTAYPVLNTNEITLNKRDGSQVSIRTQGFDNFMLWTEVCNMVCIEPVTAYPYSGAGSLGKNLFNLGNELDAFKVTITPTL